MQLTFLFSRDGYASCVCPFPGSDISITKTRLFKYIENITTEKAKLSDKENLYFHICAQNIDFGYPLEPPRRGGSNEYPQFMFLAKLEK